MNKYGVKAKKGAIWSDFSVRFILRNPIYSEKNRWNWRSPVKGKAYTGAEIIKEIDQEGFEPIISEELFRETEKRMKERSNMAFRSDYYYPFSGVAKCAKCGHSYTGPFKKGDPEQSIVFINVLEDSNLVYAIVQLLPRNQWKTSYGYARIFPNGSGIRRKKASDH